MLYLREYKERFDGDFYFYGNASHALYDVLTWLQSTKEKVKPNVVLPVFIPAKLYRLVLAAGYEPRFYDIKMDCSIDPQHVSEQVDENTQAIVVIHYFGIPSQARALRDISNRSNTCLIEDCAHTINSSWNNRELGTIGDCALFSSRKMLQLPAGGFLTFSKQARSFKPSYKKRVRSLYTVCKGGRIRMKTIYSHLTKAKDPLNLARIPSTGYINFSEAHRFNVKNISRLNYLYTCNVDLDKVAAIRRKNYEYVLNGIKDLSFVHPVGGLKQNKLYKERQKVFHLRKGITPYSFPVIVPSESREVLRKILRNHGIGCGAGWPEAPFGLKGFKNTAALSKKLLEIPIHQGMTHLQLEETVKTLHWYEKHLATIQKRKSRSQNTRNSKLNMIK